MQRNINFHLCEKNKKYSSIYSINQRKGIWAEDYVIADFIRRGWKISGRRKKLINGEVDLIFRRDQEIIFIEVKYINNSWNVFERITKEQKRKLIANRVYYSLRYPTFSFFTAVALVSNDSTNKLNLIHLEE